MQNTGTAITKKPLREDVHVLLRDRIVEGALLPGSRLQDSQLAGELGVSRTPIREALLRLEKEGLVETDPNRGFFVAPLTRETALQVYPIVWTLECLALNSATPLTRPQHEALQSINEELAAVPANALRCHELDMRWHQMLVEPCGNQCLLDLLASLKQIVRRYECNIYMQDPLLVRRSVKDHNEILDALMNKRAKLASQLLERNWRVGLEFILKRLDEFPQTKGK